MIFSLFYKHKQNVYKIIASAAIGGLFFVLVLGIKIIDPTNISWLMEQGDWPQHFLGWHLFRNEAWTFPLGKLVSIQPDIGASIGYTDSIPIMAFIFKPFSSFLPNDFQYIGIWLFLCFVLQGVFGGLLISSFTKNIVLQILGATFFVLSPILLLRIPHPALCSHWILLAGLWLYFREKNKNFKRHDFLWWMIIVILSAVIHPTITIIIFGLAIAFYLRLLLIERVMKPGVFILDFGILIITTIFLWWIVGYFELGRIGGNYGAFGSGNFSMNLLAPINPMTYGNYWKGSWSVLLPAQPLVTKGQMDGFSYLGVGIIVLGILMIYKIIVRPPRLATIKIFLPLIFLSLFFTFIALSYKITFGNHVLFKFNLNHYMLTALSVFRASGRFFWPVYYLLFFIIIAFHIKRNNIKISIFLLVIGISLQIVDFHKIYNGINLRELRNCSRQWSNPLKSKLWSELGAEYKKIKIIPPLFCENNDDAPYIPFAYMAANYHMSTNSFYLARYNYDKFYKNCQKLNDQMHSGQIDSDSIYILNDSYLKILRKGAGTYIHCNTIDGFNVCLGTKREIKYHND